MIKNYNYFFFILIIIFSLISSIYSQNLDVWHLINNSIRVKDFINYSSTSGIGFSIEALISILYLFFPIGFSHIILLLLFNFIIFLSIKTILSYFHFSKNKILFCSIITILFNFSQITGLYWDNIGATFALSLIALILLNKKKFLILIVCLSVLLFWAKQNSGLSFIFIIIISYYLSIKNFNIYYFIIYLLLFITITLLLHFYTFNNFNVIDTFIYHIKVMFSYFSDNKLGVSHLKDNGNFIVPSLGRIFPLLANFLFEEFYPAYTIYALIMTPLNIIFIFYGINILLFEKNIQFKFIYLSIIGLHFFSVIFWGRNWTEYNIFFPLLFFLTFPKIQNRFIKKISNIFFYIIVLLFFLIFLKGLYSSIKTSIDSPIFPIRYGVNFSGQNNNSELKKLTNILKKEEYDCIFTIGEYAHPLLAYGLKICSDRSIVANSFAILDLNLEDYLIFLEKEFSKKNKIIFIDSCEDTNCRIKNNKLYYDSIIQKFNNYSKNNEKIGIFRIYYAL